MKIILLYIKYIYIYELYGILYIYNSNTEYECVKLAPLFRNEKKMIRVLVAPRRVLEFSIRF